jgi:hypothetical protein
MIKITPRHISEGSRREILCYCDWP